jgi:hypothetical protein
VQEIFIDLAQRPRQEGEFFAREVIGLKVRTIEAKNWVRSSKSS